MINNKIAIFLPTALEMKAIFNIEPNKKDEILEYTTYRDIPLIITGAGKTNSSLSASYFATKHYADIILLTGICGAYRNTEINIGDTVSIKYDYFVDEAEYNKINIKTMHEKGFISAPDNRGECLTFDKFKTVNSNTISLIPLFDELSNIYQNKTNASVENMEGASFAYTLNKFNIKPYQIRTVSNYCGNKELQQWNIKKACKNLKDSIDLFIDNFA